MNDRTYRQPRAGREGGPDFLRHLLITVGVVSAAVAAFLLVWKAAGVFVLLFAGVLLAVVLRGAAEWIAARTPLSGGWALATLLLALAALLGGAGWVLGSEVAAQFQQLSQDLMASTRGLEGRLKQNGWWPQSLELPSAADMIAGRGNVIQQITGAFSATFGALANAAVVVFVGLFIAAQPRRYRDGVLHLVPPRHRPRLDEVLDTIAYTLRWWVAGRLIDMVVVGALTTVGLLLLGVPAALALGLLTTLLVFIPYIGPILSAIPATLVALTQGPEQALYVLLLYGGVQSLESYFLEPYIQDRNIDLPPAMVIGSQLLLGVLLGVPGVMFATPLMAAGLVTAKLLYVKDTLGDPIEVAGEPASSSTQQAS